MTTILYGPDWDVALRNILQILKPGGRLQWIDIDASAEATENRLYCSRPAVSRKAVLEVTESAVLFEKYTKRKVDGIKELRGGCDNAGMKDVDEEIWSTAKVEELRSEWMRVGFVGAKRLFEWLMILPGRGQKGYSARQKRRGLGVESIGVRISMW